MIDKGNRNFFTTYKGKFAVEPANGAVWSAPVAMLTATNSVCFAGTVTVDGTIPLPDAIGVLPEKCRPAEKAYMDVLYAFRQAVGDYEITVNRWVSARIEPDGSIVVQEKMLNGILYLNGCMFNIGGKWYS